MGVHLGLNLGSALVFGWEGVLSQVPLLTAARLAGLGPTRAGSHSHRHGVRSARDRKQTRARR